MRNVRLICIARNEEHKLPALAEAVLPLIDSWCIVVDNRTTDDTVRVANELFGHLPGACHISKLTEENFNFGAARNECMNLAREEGVYLLLLDVDSPCIGKLPEELDAPAYICDVRDEHAWAWKMPLLVRSDAAGPWHMPAHEFIELTCDHSEIVYLTDVYIKRSGAGADKKRLQWTADTLEKFAQEDGPFQSRARYFLANTLYSLDRTDDALEAYIARACMDGEPEETFFSLYQAGLILISQNSMKACRAFMDAWSLRPHRWEPLFRLAGIANQLGNHELALMFANQGLLLTPTTDQQFVERWIEQWGMEMQWAIAGHHLGIPEAKEVFGSLLERDDLTDVYRRVAEIYFDQPTPLPTYKKAMQGVVIGEGSISEIEALSLGSFVAGRGPLCVAETGFGRGQSAWAFLSANPELTMVSFDLVEYEGARTAKEIIDRYFPGRHTLIEGNSIDTVQEHGADDFDLVFIDGGHDYDPAASDLRNFAKSGRTVIFDDLVDADWAEGGVKAWEEATASDGFIDAQQLLRDGEGRCWGIGRYR
jgi:tetratricopeptide (TPR) repeat protein